LFLVSRPNKLKNHNFPTEGYTAQESRRAINFIDFVAVASASTLAKRKLREQWSGRT
jgi:hypothetical protein